MTQNDDFRTAKWDAQSVRRQSEPPAPPRKKRKKKKKHGFLRFVLWLVFVVAASALLAEVGWLLANDMCAFNKEPLTASIEITREDDLSSIADKLKDAGLIEYKWFFKLFGKVAHAEDKIGIGTYELDTDLDYNALINGMKNKKAALSADTVTVTIPEGYTARQIIALLAKFGVNTEENLLDAVENGTYNYAFLDESKSGIAKLEGYLFPDTYEFYVGENAEHAVKRLLDNFELRIDDDMMDKINASPWSLQQIITIASLIEKETDGTDRSKIASVIYNRLNNVGETYHKLQIDAALIYGLGESYDGTLTSSDKDVDTPYNLYLYEGLPPTPIANPGSASIKAALDPAETSYYFYALGTDKVHHFFKTYAEHAAFVSSSQYGG